MWSVPAWREGPRHSRDCLQSVVLTMVRDVASDFRQVKQVRKLFEFMDAQVLLTLWCCVVIRVVAGFATRKQSMGVHLALV